MAPLDCVGRSRTRMLLEQAMECDQRAEERLKNAERLADMLHYVYGEEEVEKPEPDPLLWDQTQGPPVKERCRDRHAVCTVHISRRCHQQQVTATKPAAPRQQRRPLSAPAAGGASRDGGCCRSRIPGRTIARKEALLRDGDEEDTEKMGGKERELRTSAAAPPGDEQMALSECGEEDSVGRTRIWIHRAVAMGPDRDPWDRESPSSPRSTVLSATTATCGGVGATTSAAQNEKKTKATEKMIRVSSADLARFGGNLARLRACDLNSSQQYHEPPGQQPQSGCSSGKAKKRTGPKQQSLAPVAVRRTPAESEGGRRPADSSTLEKQQQQQQPAAACGVLAIDLHAPAREGQAQQRSSARGDVSLRNALNQPGEWQSLACTEKGHDFLSKLQHLKDRLELEEEGEDEDGDKHDSSCPQPLMPAGRRPPMRSLSRAASSSSSAALCKLLKRSRWTPQAQLRELQERLLSEEEDEGGVSFGLLLQRRSLEKVQKEKKTTFWSAPKGTLAGNIPVAAGGPDGEDSQGGGAAGRKHPHLRSGSAGATCKNIGSSTHSLLASATRQLEDYDGLSHGSSTTTICGKVGVTENMVSSSTTGVGPKAPAGGGSSSASTRAPSECSTRPGSRVHSRPASAQSSRLPSCPGSARAAAAPSGSPEAAPWVPPPFSSSTRGGQESRPDYCAPPREDYSAKALAALEAHIGRLCPEYATEGQQRQEAAALERTHRRRALSGSGPIRPRRPPRLPQH